MVKRIPYVEGTFQLPAEVRATLEPASTERIYYVSTAN